MEIKNDHYIMQEADKEKLMLENIKASKKDLSEFDRNFLIVVTGILAFTVTFIKDIVNIREAKFIIFLLLSWVFIALSLGFIIISYYLSARENMRLYNFLDRYLFYHKNFNLNEFKNLYLNHKFGAFYIRKLSIFSFLIGLILLFIFLIVNFYLGNKISSKDYQNSINIENTIQPSSKETVQPYVSKSNNNEKYNIQETYNKNSLNNDNSNHSEKNYLNKNEFIRDTNFLIIKPDTIYIKSLENNEFGPDS